MNKITFFLLLVGCTGLGSHAAASGIAYQNAFFTAYNSILFVECRDLTDEEMDEADNLPGSGYNDGKWTGENPPQSENENGDPAYANNDKYEEWTDNYPSNAVAIQDVYEDDEGNIWIYEDDGSITVVPA